MNIKCAYVSLSYTARKLGSLYLEMVWLYTQEQYGIRTHCSNSTWSFGRPHRARSLCTDALPPPDFMIHG